MARVRVEIAPDEKVLKQIIKLAAKENRSPKNYIETLLEQHVKAITRKPAAG